VEDKRIVPEHEQLNINHFLLAPLARLLQHLPEGRWHSSIVSRFNADCDDRIDSCCRARCHTVTTTTRLPPNKLQSIASERVPVRRRLTPAGDHWRHRSLARDYNVPLLTRQVRAPGLQRWAKNQLCSITNVTSVFHLMYSMKNLYSPSLVR